MTLYRPIGLYELKLLAVTGFRAWPARLPQQPIFYPVFTLDYARKIARDWNTVDELSGFAGFVTRFVLEHEFSKRYSIQCVGGSKHEELWVPAEELAEFNAHIIGQIDVFEAFLGPKFIGELDPKTLLPIGLL